MLRIIYGKPGTGKSKKSFAEVAELVKTEKKIYIITPEQFSFTAEAKLLEEITGNSVINAEVITLSRMAQRVIEEVGNAGEKHLSKTGKTMLIYHLLNKNLANLKFLGKTDENVEVVLKCLSEFKKHSIDSNLIDQEIEKADNQYFKTKLQDLNIIYKEYEKQIKNKYIEETDMLSMLENNIEKSDIVKDSYIYIDEFSGFTKQEYRVISKLIKLAKQVNITLCIDNLDLMTNPDIDIYYSNKQTYRKLLELVNQNELKIEEYVKLEEKHRFKTPELKHISNEMEKQIWNKYEDKVENVSIFLAKNRYSEIEHIAKQIKILVRDKGYLYKDIGIITKNLETYSSLVRTIFAEYDIPVFIDEKRDLNQNIIVKYVLSIIEVINSNFGKEEVINYIKSGMVDIEEQDIYKFENYVLKWGINRNKFLIPFTKGTTEELLYLNNLRVAIVNPLLSLKESISKDRTVLVISKQIYEFLNNTNITSKIENKVKRLEEKGYIEIANEYVSSYKLILEILDEMVTIFNKDKMQLDKYLRIFKTGLKAEGLRKNTRNSRPSYTWGCR